MSVKPSEWSYQKHAAQELGLPSCYTTPNSIDAWLHRRMLDLVRPLIGHSSEAHWLTVGDGRYGSDAHFLESAGVSAVATNISVATLVQAKERGFIKAYQAENAEFLSASDGSFDFVLCKESYHHFPRPTVAFYEMLRVARIGVVLIEPAEGHRRLLDFAKTVVKRVLRKGSSDLFEESGNFIYRTSVREKEKMMTALNHECIAFKRFNTFYHPTLAAGEFRLLSPRAALTRIGIAVQDCLCALRLMNHGLVAVVAFKYTPSVSLQHSLREVGYSLRFLPKNPYR
jgi:ubiquinone/menaquinone biosynthesis C-methylase UbiE